MPFQTETKFTPAFQRNLLVLLLKVPATFSQYRNIWKASIFDNVIQRKITEAYLRVRTLGNEHPTKDSMEQELSKDYDPKHMPKERIEVIKELFALYEVDETKINQNYSVEVVREFAQNQAFVESVGVAIDHLQSGQTERIQGLINAAGRVGEVNPVCLAGDEFYNTDLPLAKEIIPNVIRKGYIGIINGHPKSFKSWLMLHCAIAVAMNKDWLNFGKVPETKTLYVNLELDEAEFQKRVDLVCHALGLKRRDLKGKLDFLNLKGKPCSLEKIIEALRQLRNPNSPWEFVIIDDVYKMLSSGVKIGESENVENDAGAIGSFFCQLEELAREIDAAIWLVHHFKKGNAADTNNIDSGSGSGVFGRAPDAVFSIHPIRGEDKEVVTGEYVIKSDLRYYTNIEDFGVRMKFPLFERDVMIDVENLAGKSGRPPKHSKRDLLKVLNESAEPITGDIWRREAQLKGVGKDRYRELRDEILETELAEASGETRSRSTTYTITAAGKTALLKSTAQSLAGATKKR